MNGMMNETTGGSQSTDQAVLVDHYDGIAVVTLNRPQKLNAFTVDLKDELLAMLRAVGDDSSVRIVVLTGAGSSFCTGKDMTGTAAPGSVHERIESLRRTFSIVRCMRDIRQPVIAAVRGHAVGAGFALAAASDMRFVSPDVSFNPVFAKIGMTPGDLGLSWFLPRIIGAGRAAQLFYRSQVMDAQQALNWGFASEVAADPFAAAMTVARELADLSPESLIQTKELLNTSLNGVSLRDHMETEIRAQALCGLTHEHEAAVQTFRARRAERN